MNFCRSVWLIVTLVVINAGANGLIVAFQYVLADFIFGPERAEQLNMIAASYPLLDAILLPLAFMLPTILAIIHAIPALLAVKGGARNEATAQKRKRRFLNLPFGQSLIATTGWLSALVITLLGLYLIGVEIPFTRILITILNFVLLAIFSFTFVYFSLEWSLRRFFLPYVFDRDEDISKVGGLKISILFRMQISFVATGVFPTVLFLNIFLVKIEKSLLDPLLPFLGGFLFLFYAAGFSIIWLVASSYQNPLNELAVATGKIEQSDFDLNIRPYANDEVGILTEALRKAAKGLSEKEFIKDTFGRVVDPAIRDHLLSSHFKPGGEKRIVTVLFSDIRGFTGISERETPEQIVELLNEYFQRMHGPILAHRGIVNKYIGDAIMALFNAPLEVPDHPDQAVLAAIEMIEQREELNRKLRDTGLPAIKTGIGIHTGEVVAGNIGAKERNEYTVIGDAVNLASRLEGVSRKFSEDIMISRETMELIQGDFSFKRLGNVQVKGRETPVEVYTLGEKELPPVK